MQCLISLFVVVQSKMLRPEKWQATFDGDGKILGFRKALKSIILGVSCAVIINFMNFHKCLLGQYNYMFPSYELNTFCVRQPINVLMGFQTSRLSLFTASSNDLVVNGFCISSHHISINYFCHSSILWIWQELVQLVCVFKLAVNFNLCFDLDVTILITSFRVRLILSMELA